MDPLRHALEKGIAQSDSTAQQQEQIRPMMPPAYSRYAPVHHSSTTDAVDGDQPMRVVINAGTRIEGVNNVITIPRPTLHEAANCANHLVCAIYKGLGERVQHAPAIRVVLDCGINIRGDRNIVGPVFHHPRGRPAVQGVQTGSLPNHQPAASDRGTAAQEATAPMNAAKASDATVQSKNSSPESDHGISRPISPAAGTKRGRDLSSTDTEEPLTKKVVTTHKASESD